MNDRSAPGGRRRRALLCAILLPCLALLTGGPAPAAQEQPARPQEPASAGEPGDMQGAQAAGQAPADPDLPPMPRFRSGFASAIEEIANDLFFWGRSGNITGTVGDNAFMGGQFISLDGGRIDGDLFVFASSVTIDGEVAGDVYAFVADLRLDPEGSIGGNLICGCGSLRVDGTVHGRVHGDGGAAWINGDVGSVQLQAGKLHVGETARIRGGLHYESNDEAEIADGAIIGGEIRRTTEEEDAEEEEGSWISFWSLAWSSWKYLSSLLVGVAFLLVGGEAARRPAARLAGTPAWSLGFGFVVAVVVPVACLLAMALIVALPLGVIGLLAYAVAAFLGRLVTAQFVGDWVLRRLGSVAASEYLALALGLLALHVVAAIPYVGFLIRLMAVIAGLGGIYLAIRGERAPAPEPPAPESGLA
ncbi:MAG: bactofilin family protein [Acidobacteriota bacterium]